MKKEKMKTFIMVAFVLCLTSGYSSLATTIDRYSVVLKNIGREEIDVDDLKFGDHYAPCGRLMVNGRAMSLNHRDIPESVKIKWKKADKSIIEREVKIKENLPSIFKSKDAVVLNINDKDEVILSFELWSEDEHIEIDSKGNEVDYSSPDKNDPGKALAAGEEFFTKGYKNSIVFRNMSKDTIYFSTAGIFDNNDSDANDFQPVKGIDSNLLGDKLIKSVKVRWVKKDKSVVDREIKLQENFPKDFDRGDTIVFNINDKDEVILSFKIWGSKLNEIDSNGNEVDYSAKENPDKTADDTGDGSKK